jgi:hypothetical protein
MKGWMQSHPEGMERQKNERRSLEGVMKAVWNPSPRASSTSLDSGMFASPRRKLAREGEQ